MNMLKTPVTSLQELMQKRNSTPHYDLLPSEGVGTHNPTFRYKVTAGDVIGFGKARSKKEAKHEAARDALAKYTEIGLYIPEQSLTPPVQISPIHSEKMLSTSFQINAVGMMKDFAAENNLPPPEFREISDVGPAHQRMFTYECKVGSLTKTATETTKKKAKQTCAQLMYQCLLESLPAMSDNVDFDELAITDKPQLEDVFNGFSENSVYHNKKKENYKLKVSEFSSTFLKIMHEKKISYNDLWKNVLTENEATLESILKKFDLKYHLNICESEEQTLVMLIIDSEPSFVQALITNSVEEAVPVLMHKTFEFLRNMSK